jgi:hypothetical protein
MKRTSEIGIGAGAASRLRTFLARSKARLLRLNIPMPCPPRGTVPVHQERGLEFFTQHARVVFGQGCDCPGYVEHVHRPTKRELQFIFAIAPPVQVSVLNGTFKLLFYS